jgi:phospholipid-transporting ATPase
MCYIDTCNLDGETNLKIRSSIPATSCYTSSKALSLINGSIEYDAPNNRLYNFTGTLSMEQKKFAVDNESILLRGGNSIVRIIFTVVIGDSSHLNPNNYQ